MKYALDYRYLLAFIYYMFTHHEFGDLGEIVITGAAVIRKYRKRFLPFLAVRLECPGKCLKS